MHATLFLVSFGFGGGSSAVPVDITFAKTVYYAPYHMLCGAHTTHFISLHPQTIFSININDIKLARVIV